MTTGRRANPGRSSGRSKDGGKWAHRPAARSGSVKRSLRVSFGPWSRSESRFWVLGAFLVMMFGMAGSCRVDNESLMIVRPLSAIVLGFGLSSLTMEQIRAYRWLFVVAVVSVAVAIAQLLPLPAQMIYAMSGHGVVAEIDRAIGNYGAPHPISLTPTLTRNALWSMMGPLAVLVLGVQLSTVQQGRLLPLLILIGIASAALGVLQILGDPKGIFYTFQDTDNGLPVGLFANRNHQAVFLATMLPMLAVWLRTAEPTRRATQSAQSFGRPIGVAVLGAGLLLIILLTGSRSGVAMALLACLGVPLVIYRPTPRRSRPSGRSGSLGNLRRVAPIALVVFAGLIVLAAVWSNRALSLDRLFTNNIGEDMRVQILPTLRSIIAEYWPMGSGLGSFIDVFRMHESADILMQKSMNNAHDDWLEALMTAGAPGAAILVFVTVLWLSRVALLIRSRNSSTPPYIVRLGFFIFLLYTLASFTDYHVQDGSISCLIVVVAIWMNPVVLVRQGVAAEPASAARTSAA